MAKRKKKTGASAAAVAPPDPPKTPINWRKHLLFGLVIAVGCAFMAFTGGGRDADRADALAVSALVKDNAVGDAIDPASVEAWQRIHGIFSPWLEPFGATAGLPVKLRTPEASERQRTGIVTALSRLGVDADGSGLEFGTFTVKVLHAPRHRIGVEMAYAGPATPEHTGEVAAERMNGPWWSVLPPLFAVIIALFYRKVILALLAAVMLGAALHFSPRPDVVIGETLRHYAWGSISDSFKLYVLAFTIALVGMIQVAAKSGGNQGLIEAVSKLAKTARSTRIVTAFMGLVVFFDDYANSVIVGTSARPLTDRKRISREKLAYIVDSTAAPVAGIAIISTWVGYEVGLFDAISTDLALGQTGFEIFLGVLPTRFYCFLALVFVFTGAALRRDYGPMLAAERRALTTGDVGAAEATGDEPEALAKEGAPPRWYNAAIPVLVTILGVIVGVAMDGSAAITAGGGAEPDLGSFDGWQAVFSNADSGKVLFFASLAGSVIGILMVTAQRILTPAEALKAWLQGAMMMRTALAILLLAWMIQTVTKDLGTSYYLVSVLEPILHPAILPIVIFLAAAAVAFATGTSWGTMGILLPALIPLAWVMTGDMLITLLCMGAVLDGAIFGDHCSPISDTTVMSSLACGCDHIEHVRTQLPYAVTVMLIAAVFGYLARPLGIPMLVCYALGIAAIFAVFLTVGKPVEEPEEDGS